MRKLTNLLVLGALSGSLLSGCGLNNGSRPKAEHADGAAGISRSGGYELPRSVLLGACPFLSDTNPFNFDGVLASIRSQLESKIQGQESCRAKQQYLSDGFSQIQSAYFQLNQELTSARSADLYQNFVNDLQLQLQNLRAQKDPDPSMISMLQSGIFSMQDRIRDLRVNSQASHQLSQADLRIQMLSRMNDMLISLSQTEPKCIDAVGGWKALLPPLLGTASLASGYSILSGQALASGALQLMTSLSTLLQTHAAKQAFQDIVRLQNEKVLACTYYSIQHSSCEIKRAVKLAAEKKVEIRQIALRQPDTTVPAEWQTYLDLFSKVSQFESIFNTIAAQGSSLSLDVETVSNYFRFLKLNIDKLKPFPNANDPENVLVEWMDRVSRNGLPIMTQEPMSGKPIPIKEQFDSTVLSLSNAERTIKFVESKLKDSKSFEGLKHSLGALSPELQKTARQMKEFLNEQAAKLEEKDRGAVYISAKTMEQLETFMATGVDASSSSDIEGYMKRLTDAGSDLFTWISMGSVAQISKQEILALGGKAQERLKNAFQVIDNRLSRNDLKTIDGKNELFDKTFSAYKQKHLLYYQLANVYNDIKGPNSAFRQSEVDVAFSSFESGFEDELNNLIESKLNQSGGAHFCSLLSGYMNKGNSRKARHLLEECQKKFKTLEISTLSYDDKLETIDYRNECFYDEFIRTTRSFQILDWLKRGL